jgi:hypothetical protein
MLKNAPKESNKNRTLMIYNNIEVKDFGVFTWIVRWVINGQTKRATRLVLIWQLNWASQGAERQEALVPPRMRTAGIQVELSGLRTLAPAQLQAV